jgi:two-component system, sporulation sensor kinase E
MASQQDNREFKRTRDLFGNIWKRPEGGKLFDALYNNSLEIIFMIDFEGRFLDANDRGLTLFGFERDEIQSVYVADIIDEDDLPKAFEAIEYIKKYGFDVTVRELRLRNKRGRSIWLEVAGVRIDLKYKTGIILGLARDITNRKLEEASSRQFERRYKTLFDKSFEIIFIYDLYGQIVDANNRALSLLGYERDEIPSIKFADLLEKKDIPRAIKDTMLIFEQGAQPDAREYRLKTKNGGHVWVEVSGVLMEQRGEPPAIIGIGRDISTRKSAEEASKNGGKQPRSSGGVKSPARMHKDKNGAASHFDSLLDTIVEGSELVLANIEGNNQLRKDVEHILKTAQKALELSGKPSACKKGGEPDN